MGLDDLEVVNLNKYVKDHKLGFKPDTLMQFVWRQDLMFDIDENIDTTDVSPEACEACKKMRGIHKNNTSVCKKHKAIQEWNNGIDHKRMGIGTLLERKFVIFSNYVVFENPDDQDYVYVVWFGSCARKSHNMYYVKKNQFKGIFTEGYDLQSILTPNIILISGNWQVYYPSNEDMPSLENIRY